MNYWWNRLRKDRWVADFVLIDWFFCVWDFWRVSNHDFYQRLLVFRVEIRILIWFIVKIFIEVFTVQLHDCYINLDIFFLKLFAYWFEVERIIMFTRDIVIDWFMFRFFAIIASIVLSKNRLKFFWKRAQASYIIDFNFIIFRFKSRSRLSTCLSWFRRFWLFS